MSRSANADAGGLFHIVSGTVYNLGLLDVNITYAGTSSGYNMAALAHEVTGTNSEVIAVWGTGTVTSTNVARAASLVGSLGSKMAAVYFRGTVTASHTGNNGTAAGLVAALSGDLLASYFAGSVTATANASGLVHVCAGASIAA